MRWIQFDGTKLTCTKHNNFKHYNFELYNLGFTTINIKPGDLVMPDPFK